MMTSLAGLIRDREGTAGQKQNENSHYAGLHPEFPSGESMCRTWRAANSLERRSLITRLSGGFCR